MTSAIVRLESPPIHIDLLLGGVKRSDWTPRKPDAWQRLYRQSFKNKRMPLVITDNTHDDSMTRCSGVNRSCSQRIFQNVKT